MFQNIELIIFTFSQNVRLYTIDKMKLPLIQYRLVIEFFEAQAGDGIDSTRPLNLVREVQVMDDYKKIKKYGRLFLQNLSVSNKQIRSATIEPVFLQENLLG